MYVAWFSVSNFVTARLLPYVMPFDQGVMQRSFDAGLYVMRLMHGSSTAVTCTLFQFQLRRLPKERHPSGRVHADADADGRSRRRQSTRRAIVQATSLPLHIEDFGSNACSLHPGRPGRRKGPDRSIGSSSPLALCRFPMIRPRPSSNLLGAFC